MSRPPATSRKVGRVLVLLALFLVCQRATQTARALLGAGAVPFPRSVPPKIWAQNLLVARRAKADGTLGRGEAEDHEDVKGPLQPREDEDKASEKDQDEVEEATTEVSRNKAVDELQIVAFARDEQLQKTVQEKEEIKEDKGFDKSTEKDTFSQKRFDMAVKKWDGAQKDLEGAREDRDFARQRRREAVQNGNEKERKEAEEAFEKAEEAFAKAESKVETAKEEAEKANDELEKAKSTAPLQVQGARRQLPYIAPKYTMNKAFCDDKKLLVCDFENSAEFAIVSKELMQQLTAWVEECNSSRGICAINGMVKTGKSTVLTRLLPQIILTTFPDAEICFLDFAAFLDAGSEPGEMKEGLLKEVCSWATASGFDVGLADQLTLNQLMDILDRSGRTYFFLIDEVQRYFEVRQGTFPLWDTLKGFVGVNRQRSNLHFAITGSAMVLAWQNFLKMTPNGFTFVGECRKIFLPWRHPRHELDYAKCKLLATAANESERDELTELLAEISSVPLMAYTATMRKYSQSVKDTQLQVNLKLRAEFVTEMTPLLGEPTWSKPECLQYIRDLAMGGATSDPADFFDEILYGCFFEPYIQKENGKFSFADNPWTVCMAQCVDENGTLVRQSNFPVLQWYQNAQRLQQLARVGELVCGTLRQWDRMSGDDKKLRRRVETICRKHGRQHGWHPKTGDPCFQQLLSWSNDGVNKSIAVRWSTKQRPLQMKWCTYLEMLRNAKAHFTVNNQDDFAKLLFNCLPGRADLLLAALKNFTIAW